MTNPSLTTHQASVRDLLILGLSNKEIANALNISTRAVKGRLVKIAIKYGVKKRAEIIVKHHGVKR